MGIVFNQNDEMERKYCGYTWMWRKCCLKKVRKAFQLDEHEGSQIVETEYVWCFLRDVGNITFAGGKDSILRQAGLIYSQFYGMHKLQFDAKKHFS